MSNSINKVTGTGNEKINCPIQKVKAVSFGVFSRIFGLKNERPFLNTVWKKYDIQSYYDEMLITGNKPFVQSSIERSDFLSYAYSTISVEITKRILATSIQPTDEDIGYVFDYIRKMPKEEWHIIRQSILSRVLMRYMKLFIDNISLLASELTEINHLTKMINSTENEIDPNLIHFIGKQGVFPSIFSCLIDIECIIQGGDQSDLHKYPKEILGDPQRLTRAFSNMPILAAYFFENHPTELTLYKTLESMKNVMKNGHYVDDFNISSLKLESLYYQNDWEKIGEHIKLNHPHLLEILGSYRGCPLLYSKFNGINMLSSLIQNIAYEIIIEIRKYQLESSSVVK